MAVIRADEIDAIGARAARVPFGRTVLTLLASIFYVIGWTGGAVWYGLVWASLAIKVGWMAGSRREVDISS